MKFAHILIIFCIFATCLICHGVNYDTDKINAELKKCHIEQTSKCYLKLSQKYDIPFIKYCYALALADEKQISKAKIVLRGIVEKENENSKVYKLAYAQLDKLNELSQDIRSARFHDTGDYYNQLKDKAVWQKPSNIKVFIKGNTNKEFILKNAFGIWDKCQSNINFVLTQNEKDADIICYFVQRLDGNHAGITKLNFIKNQTDSQIYIKKAQIQISLNKSNFGGAYTNSELLSITLHEVGHAIGIVSHSDNINDIMYFSTQSYQNAALSRRDINTVRKMYKLSN